MKSTTQEYADEHCTSTFERHPVDNCSRQFASAISGPQRKSIARKSDIIASHFLLIFQFKCGIVLSNYAAVHGLSVRVCQNAAGSPDFRLFLD